MTSPDYVKLGEAASAALSFRRSLDDVTNEEWNADAASRQMRASAGYLACMARKAQDRERAAKAAPSPQDLREQRIRDLCEELAETLIRKNRDYGPHAIADAPGGPMNGLRVRIFDKHARFQNLSAGDIAANWEPLEDTCKDVAGYGVIATLVARGLW